MHGAALLGFVDAAIGWRNRDQTMNRGRTLALILVLWAAPPLAVSLASILPGLAAVLQTGMCPAAPPDISAYPCTAYEYLARMTVGPWALFGHLTLAGAWTVCLSGAIALAAVWRVARRSSNVNTQVDNASSRRLR